MDYSLPGDHLKYTDISAEEAKTAKPLNLLGDGPMAHADTGMLSALKRSYLERGTPLMASQLELSYDFKSGDYKGDPQLLSKKSTGLAKGASTAAWDPNSFTFRAYYSNNTWGYPVGNGNWIGDQNATYQTVPRLAGWQINTNVVNGTTPSLYWKMYWGGYGWTGGTYSWNDYGASQQYYWQGFVAQTTYAGYNVCYEFKFSAFNLTSDTWGCNGYRILAGAPSATATAMKFWITAPPPN